MMAAYANVGVESHGELISPNVSTNPFLMDMRETVRADMDSFNSTGGRRVSGGESRNPFLVSMELTTGATPPPLALTNPFRTPARQESAAGSESMFPPQCCYDGPRNMFSTPAVALHYGANNDFNQPFDGRPANPFSPANNVYATLNAPSALAHIPASQPTVSPFTSCMSQPVRHSYAERAHDYYSVPHCETSLPWGREPDSSGYGQPSRRRAESAPQRSSSRMVRGGVCMDSSDDEQYERRERIPTLQPGRFDGSGSWKDFLYLFESCAQANHWSEKTMAVQLRFSLAGAAGAIVHKNPRSTRWSYQRIVDEVDAAYGPCSEHAAAIGIELRQRVRGPSEALHSLRDDIYDKVSIVYADRAEREQDAISVEIFTNALADAEVVQRLLEEQPRTLARAYEVAHRYETTRRAARAVTQLMQPGQRSSAERRARAATVREDTSVTLCDEPVGVAAGYINLPDRKQRFHQRWPPKNNRNVEMTSAEIICHNCSGVGHLQRNCPSPRRPRQHTPSVNPTPAPHPGTVVTCTSGLEGEMSIKILVHGLEMCALLDSAAQRNVLPLHHFDSIPVESRPQIQPSTAEVLQGIGPKGLTVMGEVTLPVQAGSRITSVNFIIASTAEGTEIILGHPFLRQARAHLDYGRREITLFGEKVPRFSPNHQPEVHIVRVARTTVLASGCEYVVPGTTRLRHAADGDMMLSPTKGFIEKHHVLVARVVVQTQQSTNIPIRVFNPGTAPVTLRKGAVAGLLQPAKVMGELELQPGEASAVSEPVNFDSGSVPSHLQSLYTESCASLSEDDSSRVARLLQSYSNVFSTGPTDLGRTSLVQHDILISPGPPVKQPPRRMASDKQLAADQQVQQSLERGVAQPSNSSWAAPIVMVRKKDQSPRLCVDYRPLNERTIKDAYPLPRIQDTLDTLSTAKYFSTLDLTSGYWQVEMTPRARKAAAFCTRKGLFEWNVMPFGLCNAPATFQRLMDRVLAGLQWETCLVYLDDIIVLGRDATEMLERLSQVFTRLREANLKLKPSKCCLFREQVAYLGHIVSARGVATDPQKIQKVVEWPEPRNISEVRQFIGLASYYRRFVQDFATLAKPLHELTKKYARFDWTAECQEAFKALKSQLTSAPVLGYPLDSGELFLDTDASDWGIGAVLSQIQGGEERVLAYGSRRLSATEQNYCTTRRELLAAVEFTSHFRQYLLGRPFTLRTDHSSLRWLTRLREPEGQLARWLEKLAEYDFQVIHRPGRHHQNADALSRRPCRESCPCTVPEPNLSVHYQHKAVQYSVDDIPAEETAMKTTTEQPPVGVEDISSDDGYASTRPSIHRVSEPLHTNLFCGWTQEQLNDAQLTDPDISPVRKWMDSGVRPSWTDVAPCSPATKAYWAQWKRLYQKDGVLLRKFYCTEGQVFYPQILLPKLYRAPVMQQMHDGPVGGHFGVERTLTRLKTRYFWYSMKEDVTLWCRTCTSCAAKARPKKTPQAAMGTVRVGAPMERIAVDLMGPLNETERHNRYILVVQDYFSKWVEAYSVPNEQAVTVAEKIASEWVCRYGAPQCLHSDQGTNFESAVFQEMCALLGINKTRTTPFHPQSDGQVERFNATLQKILATTAERCHWDWDVMIPYAVMAYRATKHSSTGLTPNMMLFGREIIEPIDLVAGLPQDTDTLSTHPQYVQQLRERLELSHQLAREVLGKSAERAKRQYDKNICQVQHKVGDAVWYLIKGTKVVKNKVRKFLPSYEGPYFVVGLLDDLVYRIKKSPRAKNKVVHHDRLKPYHSRVPLDTSWVLQDADTWAPVEVLPPSLDSSSLTPDVDSRNLVNASSDTEDAALEALPGLYSSSEDQSNSSQLPALSAQPQLDGAGTQSPAGRQSHPLSNFMPLQRPQRGHRPPDMFGDWVSH